MRISDWSSDVVLFRSPGGGAVKRLLSIASLLAIISTPALAEDTPRGGPADPRVKFVEYQETQEIGRASCRERVCQYVEISVVAVSLKKKLIRTEHEESRRQRKRLRRTHV